MNCKFKKILGTTNVMSISQRIVLFVLLSLFMAHYKVRAQGEADNGQKAKSEEEQKAAIQRGLDQTNGKGPEITAADMLASCLNPNPGRSRDTLMMQEQFYHAQRSQLCGELLRIFKDHSQPNYARCAAAYYLGELRVPEAADDLASEITLYFQIVTPGSRFPGEDFMSAAFTAVLKIGSPALPALVKNLESSDDADMRRSSLEAICEIDGKDKDLSQFRLREAIQRQTDSKKKERLQSALQILLNDSKFQK